MMPTRVTVTIEFPREYTDQIKALLEKDKWSYYVEQDNDPLICTIYVHEVRGGNLDNEKEIMYLGIPCDITWESSDEYEGGGFYIRFDEEGTPVLKQIWDSDSSISLELLNRNKHSHKELIKIIEKAQQNVYVPLLDEPQIRNGKKYKLLRALGIPPEPI